MGQRDEAHFPPSVKTIYRMEKRRQKQREYESILEVVARSDSFGSVPCMSSAGAYWCKPFLSPWPLLGDGDGVP